MISNYIQGDIKIKNVYFGKDYMKKLKIREGKAFAMVNKKLIETSLVHIQKFLV